MSERLLLCLRSNYKQNVINRFSYDEETWNVDRQFMWGGALLVTPVLEENATSVRGYFPPGVRWFDLRSVSFFYLFATYMSLTPSFSSSILVLSAYFITSLSLLSPCLALLSPPLSPSVYLFPSFLHLTLPSLFTPSLTLPPSSSPRREGK